MFRLSIAALALLLLAPLPAAAQNWYRVSRGGDANWYIDLDSLHQDGPWLRAYQISIYDKPAGNGELSTASDVDFDCKANTQRFANFAMFDPNRVQLAAIDWPDKGKIHPVEPRTVFGTIFRFVCNVDRSNAVHVADPFTDNYR